MSFWMTSQRPVARVRLAVELSIFCSSAARAFTVDPHTVYDYYLLYTTVLASGSLSKRGNQRTELKGPIQQVVFRLSML